MCLGAGAGTYTCDDLPLPTDWQCVTNLIASKRGVEVVNEIKDYSKNNRTAKQPALLMALAVCARSKDLETKQAVYSALPEICRIPTSLFLFVKYIEDLGKSSKPESTGWGRALRKAISSWYTNSDPKQLAMFVTKYRQRSGWSHKDLLRLSHTNPKDNAGKSWFQNQQVVLG
jgi:60 kDa SS-A/Ro ribonucleoprotein